MKICTKCKIEKKLFEFNNHKRSKDGKQYYCKECSQETNKTYYSKNKEYYQLVHNAYDLTHKQEKHQFYLNNRDKTLKQVKKYQQDNKDKNRQYQINYRLKNKKDIKNKHKKYYEENKNKLRKKAKEYRDNHTEEINNRYNQRRKNDIEFHILMSLRIRICNAIKRNTKSASTKELLGCTVKFLKKHLESQFKENMSWKNHGVHGWHIDHIRPCASFNFTKVKEQRKCFNYKNLQPLWAKDNLIKSDNI